MSFQQSHPEGICLRYPENLGSQPNCTHEMAVTMLTRAAHLSQHTPFAWSYIDKPPEGNIFVIFVSPQLPFPSDGIRYQEQEQRYVIPAGNNRELEVMEVKFGFVPGQDTTAYRIRRRFRLLKGGHPQLVLIHYSRGQPMAIIPALNHPARSYPLRPINEPSVYVMGEKMGQKVYPGGPNPGPGGPSTTQMERQMGMNFGVGMGGNPQALLAQQNNSMEALDRRRERSGSMSAAQRQQQQQQQQQQQARIEEDDSADESDWISTRTLALARYKRNHELMNEVFWYAAFGDKKKAPQPSPYSIFTKSDLEERVAKLTEEVDGLKAKSTARNTVEGKHVGTINESEPMSITA